MTQKQDNSKTLSCHCGTTPELISKVMILSKDEMFVFKCPKCGQEGEMLWAKDSIYLVASWNHTIRGLNERKKS